MHVTYLRDVFVHAAVLAGVRRGRRAPDKGLLPATPDLSGPSRQFLDIAGEPGRAGKELLHAGSGVRDGGGGLPRGGLEVVDGGHDGVEVPLAQLRVDGQGDDPVGGPLGGRGGRLDARVG